MKSWLVSDYIERREMLTTQKATVLIADDAPLIRRLLKDILRESSFRVIGEAVDGDEAIRLYAELQPDLVLMDIMMPGLDGIEATRVILRQDPEARVIMCTTVGQQRRIIEALQAGARDFLVKPIVPAKLLEAMRKVWAQ